MRFVYEVEFPLEWADPWWAVSYSPSHPKAVVEHVFARPERDASGRIERYLGVLVVRDADSDHNPGVKQVVVARKAGRITETPEWAGKLIGTMHTDNGLTDWYVFEARAQPVAEPPERLVVAPPAAASPPPHRAPGSAPPAPARRRPSTPPPGPAEPQAPPAGDDWLSGLT